MTDWLDRLLVALREAEIALSAEDVADFVWLAPHLDPPPAGPVEEGRGRAEEPEDDEGPSPGEGDDEADEASAPAPEPSPGGARPSGGRRGELYLPGDRAGSRPGGGRPLRAPTGSALPGSLALARALRPLRRRVASRTRRVLDVAETVRRVAEEGAWLPALRPALDRWLELSMVVDVGASMGPWRSATTELLALFSSLGAFRSVRVWSLETDVTPIRLRAGLARRETARRDPRELVDPAGRSLIVVLTDGVAESWSDGQAARLVEAWARSGPVALLQVLPEHLWTRSALGLASAIRISAHGPAAANSRLDSRSTDPWADPLGCEGSPLPVASLTPQGLSTWARVVAGSAGAQVPGIRLDLAPAPTPSPRPTPLPPTPRERLDRFCNAASPPARQLAGLLAASPAITLPVIRLVREALLSGGRQVHEAEVLLGGLLRIVDVSVDPALDPDEVRYDFHDGLRALLLDAVPSADALDVLGRVSSYVEENLAHGVDFRAMLADPAAAAGSIALNEHPFARVAAEVLLRLGGDYARLVSALPANEATGPIPGPAATPLDINVPDFFVAGPAPPLGSRAGKAPPPGEAPRQPVPPPHAGEDSPRKSSLLGRPRVRISHDVESGDATEKRELPFVIGVLADLSGQPSRRVDKLSERKFVEIDRDNFDEVMRAISPRLTFQIKDLFSDSNPDDGMVTRLMKIPPEQISSFVDLRHVDVALNFRSIGDFDPRAILEQWPEFRKLFEDKVRRLKRAREYFRKPHDRGELDAIEKEKLAVERVLTSWMRAILHHPDFRRLEATWVGLHYLVNQAETSTTLKIRALDVSKRGLVRDQDRSAEFDQSALFARVYEEGFGLESVEPFGLLIVDYEFDQSPEDVRLLTRIASVAATVNAPFVAAPGPSMFDMETLQEMPARRDLLTSFDKPQSSKWRAFRDSEEARFVGLVLPRLLGRLPYGAKTIPVEDFPFEEWDGPPPHDGYLWVNGAWAFAARVAQTMATHGWPAAIRGSEDGLVRGLPVHTIPNDRGGYSAVGPFEAAITDRREYELTRSGFIPLVPAKEGDSAMFLSTPSCQLPKTYDQPEISTAASRASQINMTLCVSRFVHHLKILCRGRIGSSMSMGDQEAWLNSWIRQYVGTSAEGPPEVDAARPLADARIVVEEAPGKPGSIRVILHIKPAYQLDELPVSLRTVFEVPRSPDRAP